MNLKTYTVTITRQPWDDLDPVRGPSSIDARLLSGSPRLGTASQARTRRYAAILTAAVIVAGGYAYASAENTTTGMGMWWALVTATTVGYGDVSPHTELGRAIGAVVMIIGTGFVALLTAAAQRFLSAEIREDLHAAVGEVELSEVEIVAELRRVQEQLDRLSAAVERRATVTRQDRAA